MDRTEFKKHIEKLKELLSDRKNCIFIGTEYTHHYIERVMSTCSDRGRWKWFAETNSKYIQDVEKIEAAQVCHIDAADLFPRYYFLDDSLINEIIAWLDVRGQEIIEVKELTI